jgi:hypothetical protein
MKNGFPAPNKELAINRKHHLTRKAPYKFESGFLQQAVCLSGERRGCAGKAPHLAAFCGWLGT